MTTKLAIIIFGLPGSGKGTQANEIVRRFDGFNHFDTGRVVEETIQNPQKQDDPVIQTERERFKQGYLMNTQMIVEIVRDGVLRIASSGSSIVLSGSPRIRAEAEFLIPLLIQLYGEGAVMTFHIKIKEETSVFRNTRRRICKSCGEPVPWSEESEKLAYCTHCGGELITRALDTEEAIKLRLVEYHHQTEGVLDYFKAMGLPVCEIDGERPPEIISDEIAGIIEERLK